MPAIVILLGADARTGAERHPAHGHPGQKQALDAYAHSKTTPASWSQGDMVFYGPTWPVGRNLLTLPEQYMVAGSASSSLPQGGLPPWYFDVFAMVLKYHAKHGSVPTTWDEKVITDLMPKGWDPKLADIYRNPITGEWPRLNASTFSPGDVYIKILDDNELDWVLSKDYALRRLVKDGKDVVGGSSAKLSSPVFYMRVYGEKKPLMAGLQYMGSTMK